MVHFLELAEWERIWYSVKSSGSPKFCFLFLSPRKLMKRTHGHSFYVVLEGLGSLWVFPFLPVLSSFWLLSYHQGYFYPDVSKIRACLIHNSLLHPWMQKLVWHLHRKDPVLQTSNLKCLSLPSSNLLLLYVFKYYIQTQRLVTFEPYSSIVSKSLQKCKFHLWRYFSLKKL